MQIPKRMSSPAGPSKPSFLDHPAEIRNAIYEHLFKRDEPVLLHSAKAYHAETPECPRYAGDAGNYLASLKHFDKLYECEIGQDQPFLYDLQLVTPFLLTCRQVYSETVGYLYDQNAFLFSRPLHRQDDREDDNWCLYDNQAYQPLNYAAQWLTPLPPSYVC